MGDKLKILWLCTFSNAEKRAHLKLWRNSSCEIGQWIPNLLQGFYDDDKYDIHVVSPEGWMRKGIEEWVKNGVTYHAFQPGIPGIGYSFRFPFEPITKYFFNRCHINDIVKKVRPDLIHLFGVENPEYGAAIFDQNPDLPILVTIQGFVSRQQQFHSDYVTKVRCFYEGKLLQHCKHYTGDYDSEKLVRNLNSDITWRYLYFPVNEKLVSATSEQEKQFDVLFAGGLTKAKGFYDFLRLVQILKINTPSVRAAVVGCANSNPDAKPMIEQLGIEKNIVWLGHFPDQTGLFQSFKQSKVFVAPTYNDAFASTLRENMLLGIPCVAYRTGGIPYANRNGEENIVIVEQGDLRAMSVKVIHLLNNEVARISLAERAMRFAVREFSLMNNVKVIKEEYERLLDTHVAI